MTLSPTTTNHILAITACSSGCSLEDIVSACPELTWNQVFLAIDQLSRKGLVCLTLKQPGRYIVTPATTMTGLS